MTQATTWGVPTAADAPVTPVGYTSRLNTALDALLTNHSGATRPTYAEAGTLWRDSESELLYLYDGSSDDPLGLKVSVPASATAAGFPGMWAADASFLYVCVAADTWVRSALATW